MGAGWNGGMGAVLSVCCVGVFGIGVWLRFFRVFCVVVLWGVLFYF